MPTAEIITIGTELLLGEILDTNARSLARTFREIGIDLYRKTTVGDNIARIALVIQECMKRSEIIITTGGLGPTVDDPTRQAVALAVGVETEYRPDLWEQIQARFQRFGRTPSENNRRQAFVPQGAIVIENPVGTAPAFIVETDGCTIISLPGVPSEMDHLMAYEVIPYLQRRFNLQSIIKSRVLHTAGVGESQIDNLIGDLEALNNPTVGLAAHSGQVDVRITAKADSQAEAEALISPIEQILRQRLGDWVYGADQETLEQVTLQALLTRGWKLVVVEAGLAGELSRRLATSRQVYLGSEVFPVPASQEELSMLTAAYRQSRGAEVGLGVTILSSPERQEVHLILITPTELQHFTRPYGGPPAYASRWAVHHALDLLRRL